MAGDAPFQHHIDDCLAATIGAGGLSGRAYGETLAACAPRSAQWTNAETTKRLRVDRAEFHHTIRFRASRTDLTPSESKKLESFLARQANGHGIRVWVAGGNSLLDVRRQATVLTRLRKRGINGELDSGGPGMTPANGTIGLTLIRHVVTLPNCGDWSKDATTDRSNQPSSNFGCATSSNLGLMVADPGVLARGRDIGPGDGDALGRGVREYREGKAEKAANVSPLSIQSGTGGGQ